MSWHSGLQIRVLEGRDRGRAIPLEEREVTLGRALNPQEPSSSGWVLFQEPTVSRIHAVLRWDEENGHYVLHHRSRTNPSLVNREAVEQSAVRPGDRVQLGLLVFELEEVNTRAGKLGDAVRPPRRRPTLAGPVREAPRSPGDAPPSGDLGATRPPRKHRPQLQPQAGRGGYRLVAAQGPDRGTNFPLLEAVLAIGRHQGRGETRQEAGILLSDEELPAEQAMLVWHEREQAYGIVQSEASSLPTRIRRVVSGSPREIRVATDRPTFLEEGDVILMGESALVVRRDRFAGQGGPARGGLLRPGRQHERSSPRSPFRSPPVKVKPEEPPLKTPLPEEEGGGVPEKAPEALQKPPEEPAEPEPVPDLEFGSTTSPWQHRCDYVFGILRGKHRGQRIALLASELRDGREITLGSPGERLNDIEVEDSEVANDQAVLRYREGTFHLVNQRGEGRVFVNGSPLKEGMSVVLQTGDQIEAGDTVFVFLERRVIESLRRFYLEVVSGVKSDEAKIFELRKQRLTIGRGANCDLRLEDPEVSRLHAVLVHRKGRYYLQHRSETNPTFVNGISLLPGTERMLTPEDRIQLSSNTILEFKKREPA